MELLPDMNDFEADYEDWVERETLDLVRRGTTHFNEIVISLPGVYPSIAYRALERLAATHKIPKHIFEKARQEVRRERPAFVREPSNHRVILPIEHPLDYDWRFNQTTARRLLSNCVKLTGPGERVALIGCPTVLREAVENDFPGPMTLIDKNRAMIECFATTAPEVDIIHCDVTCDTVPELLAAAVIIDPPWYEDYIRAFVGAACRVSAQGAYLLVSLPPIGTRPGMERERQGILEWAEQRAGLTLISLERAALSYVIPLFELNALRVDGFNCIPLNWRRGDLAILRRTDKLVAQETVVDVTGVHESGEWIEENISDVRIRIRKQEEETFRNPSLLHVLTGDILPSVSRRDMRRGLADVWTSGNRIFSCRGRSTLRLILKAINARRSPIEEVAFHLKRRLLANEAEQIIRVAHQISEIVRLERAECSFRGATV